MRKFTEFEKKTIKKILDLHSKCQTNCAYNVFFDLNRDDSAPSLYGLLPGFDLRFNGNKYALYLDTNKYDIQNFNQIFFGLITQFYEYIFLMDYLVENKYVALAKCAQSSSVSNNDGYIETDFLGDDLQNTITEYFSCYYYPTNKLYDMVEHDFLDLEGQEKKEEKIKQKNQFWITTIISITAVIVSFSPLIMEKIKGKVPKKVEIQISGDNNKELPVYITNDKPYLIEIEKNVHIEEDNPKTIPLDVNVNINYPKTPQDSK